MLSRIVPPLAAFGMAVLPAVAMAQTVIAHALTYTASPATTLAGPAKPPGTNMPMVTPSQAPMAMLQSNRGKFPGEAVALKA